MNFKDYILEVNVLLPKVKVKVKDIPIGTKQIFDKPLNPPYSEIEFTENYKKWIGKIITVHPAPSNPKNWFISGEWDNDTNYWSDLWFHKSWLDFNIDKNKELSLDI